MGHVKTKPLCFLAFSLLFFLTACAATAQRSFISATSYDAVFNAIQQSATACGFAVTSASKADGFVSANQAVFMGSGTQTTLTAQIARNPKGTSVNVSIVPPPGTVGNVDGMMQQFEAEMRKRISNVQIIKNP